jgi:G3E family GTPase
MTTPPAPIPTTILSGFLGSGKTTLLNRILHGDHGQRIAVLVNDFGEINIDTQLVVGVEGETVSLQNGCICCTIRDDLLTEMVRMTERDPRPDYIVIEASGVSDPVAVANTLMSAQMSGRLVLDAIVTMIDAEQFETLTGADQVLAIDQLGVADIVVLNKVDLVGDKQREHVKREFIRRVVPDARIIETSYADVPLGLILGIGQFDPTRILERDVRDVHVHGHGTHDHHHSDHSVIFDTWNWRGDGPRALKRLRRAVDRLPTNIYRAKGVFEVADDPRRYVLQVVGRRAWLEPSRDWGPDAPYNNFVVIGTGGLDMDALQAALDATAHDPTEQGGLVGQALSWLRGKG